MAGRLLTPPEARKLLSAESFDASAYHAHARAFLEAGRPNAAMAFLEKAPEASLLERVRDQSVAEGDAFLLAWVERIGKAEVTREHWARAAEAARAGGKEAFAREAEKRARITERTRSA